jgi:hypothetical protein
VSTSPPVTPGPLITAGGTTTTAAPRGTVPPPDGIASGWAIALDNGAYASQVFVFRTDGSLQMTITPFGNGYRGGVRFARADVNGDGTADVITTPKEGIEARVRVWDGKSGALVGDFVPYAGFTGGLYVAAGDVDGDGRPDLVIGAWQYGGAAWSGGRVRVHSGRDGRVLQSFTGRVPGETLGFDAVGLGDVDGDGATDYLVTSAWSMVNGVRSGRTWVLAGRRAR